MLECTYSMFFIPAIRPRKFVKLSPSCVVGGSFMNILAVNIARHKACPEIKSAGLYGQKRLKIYVSAEVTYPPNN